MNANTVLRPAKIRKYFLLQPPERRIRLSTMLLREILTNTVIPLFPSEAEKYGGIPYFYS
jgi:hypothetical protein